MTTEIRKHPFQTSRDRNKRSYIPEVVALRAYEVYCAKYGEQPALVDLEGRGCRGGFGTGELIAFLYARSFPKEEWRDRVEEAFRGMENTG